MSAEQPIDIVLKYGVISFDGRVIELFGLAGSAGDRIHVGEA